MVHAQAAHMINIYELGTDATNNNNNNNNLDDVPSSKDIGINLADDTELSDTNMLSPHSSASKEVSAFPLELIFLHISFH